MWEGIIGEFMSILPRTLIVVLASSLFVALIMNPAFIARFMKIDNILIRAELKKTLKYAAVLTVIAILFYLANIWLLGTSLVPLFC